VFKVMDGDNTSLHAFAIEGNCGQGQSIQIEQRFFLEARYY